MKRIIPEAYKRRAKELFFKNVAGKRTYSVSKIYEILSKEFPEVKIARVSLYKLIEREGWKREYAARIRRAQEKVLKEKFGFKDKEEDENQEEPFDKALENILKNQLWLAGKLYELLESMEHSHSSFCRVAETLNKVNHTTFRMLSELGYGLDEPTFEKPVIIINEIDGRTKMIS